MLWMLLLQSLPAFPCAAMMTKTGEFASSDAQRLDQLQHALSAPEFGAVWIARGGYGLTRILDALQLDRVQPRPVIGFSDVTALFSLLHMAGLGPCVHGPVLHSLPITGEDSLQHLWALLRGDPVEPLGGRSWVPGTVEADLVGGNLCLLAATCGTSAQLDATDQILVLEEVGEHPYRVDRMLQQLASAGVFQGVAGIAVGDLSSCRPPDDADWTLRDVLMDHVGHLGVPVLGDLPIGHGARNHAFVWGQAARIAGDELALISPA